MSSTIVWFRDDLRLADNSALAAAIEKGDPIVPVFMHGLGKSLPRGDFLLVPFFGDVLIGDRLYWQGSVEATMAAYQTAMNKLSSQIETPEWE